MVNLITRLDQTDIFLTDITGKQVFSKTIASAGQSVIGLNNLPNGIYTVKFQHEEGLSIKKLVLNK
jgi:hypothetical protein